MATIIPIERKSAVLKRPALPCLSHWHTINLLAGCPYECRYCYAQSFRSTPAKGTIHFYANTLNILKKELPRKRKKPNIVYFSTACEPFIPDVAVQDVLYGVMRLILEHGITILISTKSKIPKRFLELFSAYPGQVVVQIGLTTVDDKIRSVMESHAGTVKERLNSLESLCRQGIQTEVRMDPLIPELTDQDGSLEALFQTVAACGATSAAASYLFLRQVLWRGMRLSIGDWSFQDIANRIYTHTVNNYCGHGAIRIPDATYRKERYAALKGIAERNGINLRLCHCKNPDITQECCHPPFNKATNTQLKLDLEGNENV